MHSHRFEFRKKANTKGLFIEGFANPNSMDRTKERIDPKGWKLENYKKNPVVLFNHGHDSTFGTLPIGKTMAIEPRDDGLYAKVKISDSKTEKISAIRDLIEEGILKTFSVGFNPTKFEKGVDPDETVLSDNELIELSIVPIPAHQDALFDISGKSLPDSCSLVAKNWYENHQMQLNLLKKRAYIAFAFNDKIKKWQANGINKNEIINKLISQTKLPVEAIEKLLNGDEKFTDQLIAAFCDVTMLNPEAIKSLENLSDPYLILNGVNELKINDKYEIIQIHSNKKNWESISELEDKLKSAGYDVKLCNHNDENFVFIQNNDISDKIKNTVTIELDNKIFALIGAKTMEENACGKMPNEKVGEMMMTDDELKASIEQYRGEAMACCNDEEGNPAAWVADEAAWNKAKEAASKTYDRSDPEKFFAVVTWLYLHRFGGTIKQPENTDSKSTTVTDEKGVIGSGTNATKPDEEPPLTDLTKQTNILLTSVLQEMQKMNLAMEKLVNPQESMEGEEEQTGGESEQKSLESVISKIKDAQLALSKRVEKILS